MKRFLALGIALLLMINGLFGQELKEGYNVIYYPGGKVSSEGTIKDGKPEGYWKTYFPNGVLKARATEKVIFLTVYGFFTMRQGIPSKK